jgi:hypothetical protein
MAFTFDWSRFARSSCLLWIGRDPSVRYRYICHLIEKNRETKRRKEMVIAPNNNLTRCFSIDRLVGWLVGWLISSHSSSTGQEPDFLYDPMYCDRSCVHVQYVWKGSRAHVRDITLADSVDPKVPSVYRSVHAIGSVKGYAHNKKARHKDSFVVGSKIWFCRSTNDKQYREKHLCQCQTIWEGCVSPRGAA